MGLFQRNPYSTENNKPIYTLGLSSTALIVGLGNVGEQYLKTRHNAGFMAVEALAAAHGLDWVLKKDLKCLLAVGNVGDTRVILCKPSTMMNDSGQAVQAVSHFYKTEPSQLVVVHDELDVDFGQIRCRSGGGAAGHNGIKSIISHNGPDFGRVRIGIGPKKPEQIDSSDFVLADFNKQEQARLTDMCSESTAILTEYISTGQLPNDTRSFLI